jgi:hypothetical protein
MMKERPTRFSDDALRETEGPRRPTEEAMTMQPIRRQ